MRAHPSSKGFERADALISVWTINGDSLHLIGLSNNTYSLKIEGIRFVDNNHVNDNQTIFIMERSGVDAGDGWQQFNVLMWEQGINELFYMKHFYNTIKNYSKYTMKLSKKKKVMLIKNDYLIGNKTREPANKDTLELDLVY